MSQKTDKDKPTMCGLSFVFVIAGIIAIIFGCVCASEYDNDKLVALYVVGSIMSGLFNFALAVIVDACQKYREAHKG